MFLKRSGTPYGEARRLRYFIVICKELLQSPSVDMDFFIDSLMTSVEKINPKLDEYTRKTGIMQSRAVARNHLRFADWLNLLRIERRLVIPNSYTVFLANLKGREDFFLTKREQVAFFLILIELPDIFRLAGSLKVKNAIKDYIRSLELSEHFIESFFEWFVDLNILRPTSHRFGTFFLTNLGYYVSESSKSKMQPSVSETYITNLLRTNVEYSLSISDDDVWTSFNKSLNKLEQYTRSEVDPSLHSAFPLILDLQIRLIFDCHVLVSTTELISKLKDISEYRNIIFNWDPLANAGYIKIRR